MPRRGRQPDHGRAPRNDEPGRGTPLARRDAERRALVYEVQISARNVDAFIPLVGNERVDAVKRHAETTRALLGSQAVWNINSTEFGGGVAEMLRSLLRYARGLGVQVRWTVVEGSDPFFRITKRLHNALHDDRGDGSPLGPREAEIYEQAMKENIAVFDKLLRPGDVVICHDPQTAGLVPHLLARGVAVVWRCHIGHERRGTEVDRGWEFLRRYLEHVPLAVFSRAAYAPEWVPRKRTVVLPPNIDPFSAKNQSMPEECVRAILGQVGLIDDPGRGAPIFTREDGSVGRVDRKAEVLRVGRAPSWETPLVVQVSRWDRMKDPIGVLEGFARVVQAETVPGTHLVLAGPNVRAVADDPEGPGVLDEVEDAWRALPDAQRETVHLAQLPMQDVQENAAIVNALQRHAAIIVQKSLREGFGLTVTEAMWKRRPVVASAVGGIQDQIRDEIDGLERLLTDEPLADRLGEAAYERVHLEYLTISSLTHWAELIELLFTSMPSSSPSAVKPGQAGSSHRGL
jgi:trehalose synthase